MLCTTNSNRLVGSASKLLLVLALVHSQLDYCNSVLPLTALVSFPAASVCDKFGSVIDLRPRAIWSYYTYSYWLALATIPQRIFLQDLFACSRVWKVWPRPIFLISVLAMRLFQVVLVQDPQFEVILLCRNTGLSEVQGLLLRLVRNVEIIFWIDSEICWLVPRILLDTWNHTCSEPVFLIRHALLSLY